MCTHPTSYRTDGRHLPPPKTRSFPIIPFAWHGHKTNHTMPLDSYPFIRNIGTFLFSSSFSRGRRLGFGFLSQANALNVLLLFFLFLFLFFIRVQQRRHQNNDSHQTSFGGSTIVFARIASRVASGGVVVVVVTASSSADHDSCPNRWND